MSLKPIAATVVIAAGLAGSGFVVSHANARPSASRVTAARTENVSLDAVVAGAAQKAGQLMTGSAPSSTVSLDVVAAQAAEEAGLLMMCEQALVDPSADGGAYASAARAQPGLAAVISSDCGIRRAGP